MGTSDVTRLLKARNARSSKNEETHASEQIFAQPTDTIQIVSIIQHPS
jgi:hypothetical protein